jgi:hypothetical protein
MDILESLQLAWFFKLLLNFPKTPALVWQQTS